MLALTSGMQVIITSHHPHRLYHRVNSMLETVNGRKLGKITIELEPVNTDTEDLEIFWYFG